jgi:hypothetical protein
MAKPMGEGVKNGVRVRNASKQMGEGRASARHMEEGNLIHGNGQEIQHVE